MTNRVVAASVILAIAACAAHAQQEGAKTGTDREPLKLYVGQSLGDATEVINRSGRKHGEGGSFRMVPDQWNLYVVADPDHAHIYVFYSKSMSRVTRLSMAFFPSRQSGRASHSWIPATEVLMHDDGSYSAHFAAPAGDNQLKQPEANQTRSDACEVDSES